jgi:hypothetical protein
MGKKKFPRMEVIEKQLTVVAEEEAEVIPAEDLAHIHGGQFESALRQLYIMYGVPRPPFNFGQGGQGGSAPDKA